MNTQHRRDDRLLIDVNDVARHVDWLPGDVLGYTTDGLALLTALLLAGGLVYPVGTNRLGAGALVALLGWRCCACQSGRSPAGCVTAPACVRRSLPRRSGRARGRY